MSFMNTHLLILFGSAIIFLLFIYTPLDWIAQDPPKSLKYTGFQDYLTRSSWYGGMAYPAVGKNESFIWLFMFLESIGAHQAGGSDNITMEFQEEITTSISSRNPVATIVKFQRDQNIMEQKLFALYPLTAAKYIYLSRVECQLHTCKREPRPSSVRLRIAPKIPFSTVLVLSFDPVDLYDVDKIIQAQAQASVIITIFSIRQPSSHYREDFCIQLYDFFHKMYFEYNLVPRQSHYESCASEGEQCYGWIIWKPYQKNELTNFFPIAGNGSLKYELQRFASFFYAPETRFCTIRQTFGGQWSKIDAMDGQWTICPSQLPLRAMHKCLVYSFGISDDWTFDDQMQALGCTVHSFDPSINQKSHKRNRNHYFHPWGLKTSLANHSSTWEMYSFASIVRKLKHVGKTINVVKMDVELAEWDFFDSATLSNDMENIEQLTFELHISGKDLNARVLRDRVRLIHKIEKHDFAYVYGHINTRGVDLRDFLLDQKWRPEYALFVLELTFINKKLFMTKHDELH